MSNEQIVSNLIAKSTTEFFELTNVFYNTANKEYVGDFEQKEYATGGTINIKIPGNPAAERGLSVTATPIQDLVIPYTITENDIVSVTRNLNSDEYLFNILPSDKALTKKDEEAVVDNYGYPAYQQLAETVETDCINSLLINSYLTPIDEITKLQPLNNWNSIASINTMATYLNLKRNERTLIMNLTDAQAVAASLQNMFNPAINKKITDSAYVGGSADKGRLAGMDLFHSEFLESHVAGPLASYGSPITVSNVSANGTQITLTGVPATTGVLLLEGDMVSIPSVYLVNQIGHNQIPYRLVCKVTADANGDGAGNVTFTVPFPLMASGEHQNVVSLPANGANVFVFPTYNQNYMYTKSGLSVVPLRMPPIYGAVNSQTENRSAKGGKSFPVHVVMQGAALELSNNYRTYCLVGKQAFAPYVLSVPSLPQ
jgi:hypothetical protein